ncbi:MAG: hypothetical protein CMJ78_17265 [Planctomycetaceae bacterium]|nr:hypothetical protein [Planctomycetaceae bacterium]
MNAHESHRRDFFGQVGKGLVGAAIAGMLHDDGVVNAANQRTFDVSPKKPHFPGKAKAVIQFFMTGGPSHIDLFDPKPALKKHAGELPRAFLDNVESVGAAGGLMPSPFKIRKRGESGLEIADVLPHLAECADDIAVIRSMWTTDFNHETGVLMMHSGRNLKASPSIGAWISYGLGSENRDLPAYVALDAPGKPILMDKGNWQSGWLPPVFQGTRFRSVGSPLLNLHAKDEYPDSVLAYSRNLLGKIAAKHRDQRPGQPDLSARIASYELAARMQLSATDALDISQETRETQAAYGLENKNTESYGRRCLMARRLVERGVRIVQIYMNTTRGDNPWDHHGGILENLTTCCLESDQPVAALLKDLKQRGLLDSTLLMWGGEFGRLPLAQKGSNPGRDHGAKGFSVWLGGGGIKGGTAYGATDEFGYHAVENRTSIHDLHATVLHCLGLDHERLVFDHHGLNERLTTVNPASVVTGVLA